MSASDQPTDFSQLLTAGKIAAALGVSDAKVKKAIKETGLEPVAKKGPCNYYDSGAVELLKAALPTP